MGYPTQKPLALYERIIQASSNPGDVVLDPFCGCATTPIAAERLGRQWIGMDLWNEAHAIILKRLQDEGLAGPDGSTDRLLTFGEITLTSDAAGTHRRGRLAGPGLGHAHRPQRPPLSRAPHPARPAAGGRRPLLPGLRAGLRL